MGVDLVSQLIYGVDVRSPGPDGRSFWDRVVAGEFGDFEEDEEMTDGGLEEHFAKREQYDLHGEGLEVCSAIDYYSGECTGTVAGIVVLAVGNRGSPPEISQGFTEAQFVAKMRQMDEVLRRHRLGRPDLWLISTAF